MRVRSVFFPALLCVTGCSIAAAAFSVDSGRVIVQRRRLSSSRLCSSSDGGDSGEFTFAFGLDLLTNFVRYSPSWEEKDGYYQGNFSNLSHDFDKEEYQNSDTGVVFDLLKKRATGSSKGDGDLPKYTESIYESIWAKGCKLDKTKQKGVWRKPIVSMDDAVKLLTTSSFALPGGAPVSAFENFAWKILDTNMPDTEADFQSVIEEAFGAVEQTRTTNPYTSMTTWINSNTDQGFLNEVLDPVRSLAYDITEAMDLFVYPRDVLEKDPALNETVSQSTVTIMTGIPLKTSETLKKSVVLGEEGLGQVFALKNNEFWDQIKNGDKSFTEEAVITSGLEKDPTKAFATYSLFMSVSVTLVKALEMHAWLSLLPDAAFRPDWNGTDVDGTVFNKYRALYNSFQDDDSGRAAWKLLEELAEVTLAPTSQFMKRFDDARRIYNELLNRLLQITFSQKRKAHRNKLWYVHDTRDFRRMYDVKGWSLAGQMGSTATARKAADGAMNLETILEEDCRDGQVALEDQYVQETKLESVNNKFHIQAFLRLWFRPPSYKWNLRNSVEWARDEAFRAGVAGSYKNNKDPTYKQTYTFPLSPKSSREADEAKPYKDVFWLLPKNDKTDYRDLDVFLQSNEGRSTVGWLGMVLANYARAYNLQFDVQRRTNTFRMSNGVLKKHQKKQKELLDTLQQVKTHGDSLKSSGNE